MLRKRSFAAKNELIDGVIHLLVESSFTKEEKRARDGQRIQQHSASTVAAKGDDDYEPSDDGTTSCQSVLK